MHHVQHGNFNELLELFCKINENEIIVDYYYFKYLGNSQTYTIFTNFVVGHIDHILQLHDKFDVQLSIKKLSVMEINKHLNYIRFVSNMLKTKYQNKISSHSSSNPNVSGSKYLNLEKFFGCHTFAINSSFNELRRNHF